MTKTKIFSLPLLLCCMFGSATGASTSCLALSETVKVPLTEYMRARLRAPAEAIGEVEEISSTEDCYKLLLFTFRWRGRFQGKQLYLSPDGRFLLPDVYDIGSDPRREDASRQELVHRSLIRDLRPSVGPPSAPVQIVVFWDLQCPFCKDLEDFVSTEIVKPGRRDVSVMFRHIPLEGHDWSRPAAEAAACAEMQQPSSLREFHRLVFQGQDQITKDNVSEKMREIARVTNLNSDMMEACIAQGRGAAVVERDMRIGVANDIHATPTIFINGVRIEGVNRSAIYALIDEKTPKRPANKAKEQR